MKKINFPFVWNNLLMTGRNVVLQEAKRSESWLKEPESQTRCVLDETRLDSTLLMANWDLHCCNAQKKNHKNRNDLRTRGLF